MNRLIIIGNGFDIAHGLKTSYKNFVEDFIFNFLKGYNENKKFDYNQLIKESPHSRNFGNKSIDIEKVLDEKKDYMMNFFTLSGLFNDILINIENLRWVDIERIYFKWLKTKPHIAIELNKEFEYIKEKLREYLIRSIKDFEISKFNNLDFKKYFYESLHEKEIYPKNRFFSNEIQDTMILNFNYTNTVSFYKRKSTILNNIHGSLNDDIVFGYGDEHDEDYLNFEKLNNNELFKFMKSFEYLKSDNYKQLVYFIEKDDYQVHIYGHSCGLSDKTMLNQIFENEKCCSIKIFFYEKPDGSNDYVERTYEISRHFNNKVNLRNKLVPFNLSKAMPQPKRTN